MQSVNFEWEWKYQKEDNQPANQAEFFRMDQKFQIYTHTLHWVTRPSEYIECLHQVTTPSDYTEWLQLKQDGDLQSQAWIKLSKDELSTDILSRDGGRRMSDYGWQMTDNR